MNNKEKYKNAINQIHVNEKLKEETKEKLNQSKHTKFNHVLYILSTAAVSIIALVGGFILLNKPNEVLKAKEDKIIKISKVEDDLPRFKSMEELKTTLSKSEINYGDENFAINETIKDSGMETNGVTESARDTISDYAKNYSKTNVQVENVDEADIVKTDGDYIYYISNNNIYILKADSLELISKIVFEENENKQFNPSELYINKNKLIILGSTYEASQRKMNIIEDTITDRVNVLEKNYTVAKVFNIEEKSNPIEERAVMIEGTYVTSRMIKDNIYFISQKGIYYYDGLKDDDILPCYRDTSSKVKEEKIECTDIAYFGNSDSYCYTLVGGFNINKNEELCVETFLGNSGETYASENNLYIIVENYNNHYVAEKSKIYKFELNDGKVLLKCNGEVDGYIGNQFAVDEYNGYLRVATTIPKLRNEESYDIETTTKLTIFDSDLNQVSSIDDLAKEEKIYAVRFMGDIGYIVTFEEVDPLFVIDLSDPLSPQVKGELKIPGYSSYLHPYDENYIIGIGYNTKQNKYGDITTDNIKMTMFDISNLENPIEMFSVNVGNSYSYSDLFYNHKSLFYNKEKDVIGFQINYSTGSHSYIDGFALYKIDLEKGFQEYSTNLLSKGNTIYEYRLIRLIYIDDTLYGLSHNQIKSYDLNTVEEKNRLDLDD